ncbi:phosphocholine-specific phospholipase C [Yinghuangia seranimata]|uniref:phosphocholine-specific phospholipase C n=1 Tax=Yinghuangia seranimata TaxID=408067 RepID=UPI00248AFC00|nr:phospholipase C, phosphocholine-specific [Yinghuangia seranimata]MDI2126491.1 phospholipase C, phosphocholine-specific [Yinghuangia seranimata]
MNAINRRRFLQLTGGTAALSALSAPIARAAAIPANRRTGTIQDIEHIVVLVQENRSFDHYFGTLRGVRGFGDPRPATQPNGKPVWYQSDGAKDVLPFRPDHNGLGDVFLQGTPHGWDDGHDAWNGGAYDRWIPAKTTTTMAHLTRDDIPFHFALADAFTICDAYHCSLMGPTDPNRYYMWTGYTGNDGKGGGPVISNAELGYGWTTYPERLEQAGVSWKIYQDIGDGLDGPGSWGWTNDAFIGNYGDNALLYFNQYRTAAPGNPLYDKARTGTNSKAGEGFFDILRADVKANRLPQVSWIAAPEAFTEHPNWPVNFGAWYTSQVLDALTANPDVWSKTALLITYDENDGFFDHVVPPYPPASPAQGRSTVSTDGELFTPTAATPGRPGPYGLGQRVPMTVVSPWSTGGFVCSETFDHTSIIRFIETRFGVREPNISPWRRAVCGDLTSAFDFRRTEPHTPHLPSTSGYVPADHGRHPDYVPTPPTNPALPKQEHGVRPARPLPYRLDADARLAADGTLRVEFANTGAAGACFHVTSATHPAGPWTYTVEAGKRLTAEWRPAGDAYAFTVHGPNGFHREFKGGTAAAGPEVDARQTGAAEHLQLTLTNEGREPVELVVADAYNPRGGAQYRLRPGGRAVHNARLGATDGWYDVTVTAAGAPGFLRRLAGHVETGRASTSDPGNL